VIFAAPRRQPVHEIKRAEANFLGNAGVERLLETAYNANRIEN
jgi:hypothetical protein